MCISKRKVRWPNRIDFANGDQQVPCTHSTFNKPDIEAKIRLCDPTVSSLKQDLRPVIVFEVEFGKPHALAEREQYAPFRRAGFPTDCPVWPDSRDIGLRRRQQRAFVARTEVRLNEIVKSLHRVFGR